MYNELQVGFRWRKLCYAWHCFSLHLYRFCGRNVIKKIVALTDRSVKVETQSNPLLHGLASHLNIYHCLRGFFRRFHVFHKIGFPQVDARMPCVAAYPIPVASGEECQVCALAVD